MALDYDGRMVYQTFNRLGSAIKTKYYFPKFHRRQKQKMTDLNIKSMRIPWDKPIRLWDRLDRLIVEIRAPIMARKLSERERESKYIQMVLRQTARELDTYTDSRAKPHLNIKPGYPDNSDPQNPAKLSGDYWK